MEFGLTQETIMLRDSARRFLKEKSPTSIVRDVLKSQEGYSRELWKEMAGLGWLGLIHDDAVGGFEGSFFDLFILSEEMGRAVLPSPFLTVTLSGLLIKEAGSREQKHTYLPSIIEGQKIMTVAWLNDRGDYDFDRPDLDAKRTSRGYELNGIRLLVPYAHVADIILVCAQTLDSEENGPTLFIIDREVSGLSLKPLNTLDNGKEFVLILDNVQVLREDTLGSVGQAHSYLHGLWHKAALLKCGEMLGGISRVLEMTVEYMKERRQFGSPLGTLQAVQHLCADMATWREATCLIAYQAAWLMSEGLPCEKEVAMAKAWCNDAYKRCSAIGHQLHGAIGFTEEHDMHLYSKHAKTSEMGYGLSYVHRSRVADLLGI